MAKLTPWQLLATDVLKEIQSTLEGGRGSYYNRSSGRIQVGHTLSNGGE